MYSYGNNDWRDYIRSRNELMHYGTPKHSGRYPWGSGENPYHHGEDSPRSRYKAKKQKIKDDVKTRRLAFNKEVQDYLDDFNRTHTKGQKLSDEDRRHGKEFSDDFNKRWAESEAKYKSDLKSAKEQYKAERGKEKEERNNRLKQKIGDSARTYLEKTAEMKRAVEDEKINKTRAYYDTILSEKSLGKALKTQFLGSDKLTAANKRIEAETKDRLAKASFSKSAADYYHNEAVNNRHLADYYDKRSKMTVPQRLKESVFQTEYYRTPYTKLNGKTTTIGRNKVETLVKDAIWDTSVSVISGVATGKTPYQIGYDTVNRLLGEKPKTKRYRTSSGMVW